MRKIAAATLVKYEVRVVDGPVTKAAVSNLDAMEPRFDRSRVDDDVVTALMLREPIFHRREVGISPEDFERMTHQAFWEVGASGRRYSRTFVLELMKTRYAEPVDDVWQISDFHVSELSSDTFLATYTLDQHGRVSRRSTIWRRAPGSWQCVYHQGTLVES